MSKKQVAILRQRGKVWNAWRRDHPSVGIELEKASLSGLSLHHADLSYAILRDANFTGSNLTKGNFEGAFLMGAEFSAATIAETVFRKANLNMSHFEDAAFAGADFSGARTYWVDFRGFDFRKSQFQRTQFGNAFLDNCNFSGSDLSYANLTRAFIANTRFVRTNLIGANFGNARLSNTEFIGCNLTNAKIRKAIFGKNSFRRSNLESVDLSGCELSGIDFSSANLKGVNFALANLCDCNLRNADLTDACLWETQRSGWNIQSVKCSRIYWERERTKVAHYKPEEFERAYADKYQIVLEFPDGMAPIELAMLPLVVEQLQAEYKGTTLHIQSIRDEGNGATVRISVRSASSRKKGEFEREKQILKDRLDAAMKKLESKSETARRLEAQLNQLKLDTFPLLLSQAKRVEEKGALEKRRMAVMFLDLRAFSLMNGDQASRAIRIVRSHAARLLKQLNGKHPNTWGDAITAVFDDSNDGLEFGYRLVRHLEIDGLVARVGMSYGDIVIAHNELRDVLDVEGPAMTEGARLEPIAAAGEVLISKALRYQPEIDEKKFKFAKHRRALKKGFGKRRADDSVECYSVKMIHPS